jgi:GNAT superfamily N-acetyltransferase
MSGAARGSATIAQERAVLRMLGVDGLDRAGHPLAASLAERYCGADPSRLAHGVLLPFVVAMIEYEMTPREVALDGASGAIDLGLEAQLLERPDRLTAAEKMASELLAAALERFDANRTATHEMRDVLGMPSEPWLAVALDATEVGAASTEIRDLVGHGADVVQIRVPASWEFAEARRNAGLEATGRFVNEDPRHSRARGGAGRRDHPSPPETAQPIPAGSQRGLAELRLAADKAAARRGCYANLMTVTSAFAAPEQAVVAAFERVDFVEADPIREIVEDNVDPERALADHAFAHRLQARAGCHVVVGAGPLSLATDVIRGIPSDAPTRAGRALALQALGVELALAGGLPAEQLMLGAVPAWVAGDGDAASILIQAWLRHRLFPGHRLVAGRPGGWLTSPGRVAELVAAIVGGAEAMVVEPDLRGGGVAAAADLAAAARTARALRSTLGDGSLHGDAAEMAALTLRTAGSVLERLAAEGWGSLLGPAGQDSDGEWLGGSSVVERASGPTSGARLLAGLL